MVLLATPIPIRRTQVRGPNLAPPTPLQGKCEEPWVLGAYRREAKHRARSGSTQCGRYML